jgi:predicted DNA-binding protein
MSQPSATIYDSFVGFRASKDLHDRLDRFSGAVGRRKSDVLRFLIVRCLNAYESDAVAINKIKQELY